MFQPIVPDTGLVGWRFLQRTYDTQFDVFARSPQIERDAAYFRANIGAVTSAQDLVEDRQLLTVALGAYGLQDDINNRFFIRKILEEGTTNRDALANRFSDTRYRELSEGFGFGPDEFLKVGEPDFVEAIIARFQTNGFEIATGAQDDTMRVALYTERKLETLAGDDMSNDAKWFTILGDPPLRQAMEKALNLPQSIGQIDIDQQLDVFKRKAREVFGSDDVTQFQDGAARDQAVTRFVLRNQIDDLGTGLSSTSIALSLLQR